MEKTRETYEKELIELKNQLKKCPDEERMILENQIEDKERILELLEQQFYFQIQTRSSLFEKLIKINCNLNKDTTIFIFVAFTSLFAYIRYAFELFYGVLLCFSFFYFVSAFFEGRKRCLLKTPIPLTTIIQCILFGFVFVYSLLNVLQFL